MCTVSVCVYVRYLCAQCRAEECWDRWIQRWRWSNWFASRLSQDPPQTTRPAFYLHEYTQETDRLKLIRPQHLQQVCHSSLSTKRLSVTWSKSRSYNSQCFSHTRAVSHLCRAYHRSSCRELTGPAQGWWMAVSADTHIRTMGVIEWQLTHRLTHGHRHCHIYHQPLLMFAAQDVQTAIVGIWEKTWPTWNNIHTWQLWAQCVCVCVSVVLDIRQSEMYTSKIQSCYLTRVQCNHKIQVQEPSLFCVIGKQ